MYGHVCVKATLRIHNKCASKIFIFVAGIEWINNTHRISCMSIMCKRREVISGRVCA
jgi:hypothetical protein